MEDHSDTLLRLAGIPINVVVASLFSLLGIIGYVLYRQGFRAEEVPASPDVEPDRG